MSISIILIGLCYLILSILLSISFIYLSIYVINYLLKESEKIKLFSALEKNNAAVAISASTIIISIGWIVKSNIEPSIDALRMTLLSADITTRNIVIIFTIILIQIVLSGFFALFSVILAVKMFMKITGNIDELALIKKNNIAMAIVLSAIIFTIALFIEPAIKTILEGLIIFPPVGR